MTITAYACVHEDNVVYSVHKFRTDAEAKSKGIIGSTVVPLHDARSFLAEVESRVAAASLGDVPAP